MTEADKTVIRNVIRRLSCAPKTSPNGSRYGETSNVRLLLTASVDPAGILTRDECETEERRAAAFGATRASVERPDEAARRYLNSWVIPALEHLLDEHDGGKGRDLRLALDLSS
jgi:hypothetical protein